MTDNRTVFTGDRTIVVGAVRYYLGRHTSAVYTVSAFIADHKHLLDGGTRKILEHDISEWLNENPTCEWCGVDDRKPWVDLLNALREVEYD